MSLVQSAKLNGLNPLEYLKDVMDRLPTQPRVCWGLTLESFNTNSFDIASTLPLLCGDKDLSDYGSRVLGAHVRNLFVAASRPTKILCLALHRDRIRGYEQKIINLGWHIQE
eukprot:gene19423-38753_t